MGQVGGPLCSDQGSKDVVDVGAGLSHDIEVEVDVDVDQVDEVDQEDGVGLQRLSPPPDMVTVTVIKPSSSPSTLTLGLR